MEKLDFGSQNENRELEFVEKKQKLSEKIKDIPFLSHNNFIAKRNLDGKYRGIVKEKYRNKVGTPVPAEYMSAEDIKKHDQLLLEDLALQSRLNEAVSEAFKTFSTSDLSLWQKIPYNGTPGSPMDGNCGTYVIAIDGNYSFRMSWFYRSSQDYAYPNPKLGVSYSIDITGSKEIVVAKGVFGFGKKTDKQSFPWFSFSALKAGEIELSPEEQGPQKPPDDETTIKFKKEIIELGDKLRTNLG